MSASGLAFQAKLTLCGVSVAAERLTIDQAIKSNLRRKTGDFGVRFVSRIVKRKQGGNLNDSAGDSQTRGQGSQKSLKEAANCGGESGGTDGLAGVGEVDSAAYTKIQGLGQTMCTEVGVQCRRDWQGSLCRW